MTGRGFSAGPTGLRPGVPEAAIPVVFIAGAGRSGSTLIDRVMGVQPGFLSLGETQFIWERSFAADQLCGCGEPFHRCPFWGQVCERAFATTPDAFPIENALRRKRAVDRKRVLPGLLASGRRPRPGSLLAAYGELLAPLYAAALSCSGARVLIDSSKDARHGLILARLPQVRLHVLHLVRDPRAVAFSWTRERSRPEIHWREEKMPIEGPLTSSGRWMIQNTLAERLAGFAASYRRLRYEDFVAAPAASLLPVLEAAGADRSELGDLLAEKIELRPAHTVSGNPMRFDRGPLRLREDAEWRSAISRHDFRSVTALTWPLLRRYGYDVMPAERRAEREADRGM
jgi:hypothetical protein